jgi:hypothetical protein
MAPLSLGFVRRWGRDASGRGPRWNLLGGRGHQQLDSMVGGADPDLKWSWVGHEDVATVARAARTREAISFGPFGPVWSVVPMTFD